MESSWHFHVQRGASSSDLASFSPFFFFFFFFTPSTVSLLLPIFFSGFPCRINCPKPLTLISDVIEILHSFLSFSLTMGGAVGKADSPVWLPETKLEAKMVEAMRRREAEGCSIRSFNSIILKFPKIDESLRKCKAIFEKFDEDSNGVIDQEELRRCFEKLDIAFPEEEIADLFKECDINEDMGMKFNEFIVLLCLVYLLKDDATASLAKSRMGMPNLEATFETLVDAFVFLDKNKDGYVSKDEMVQAINESGERSSGRIAMKRFEEMDWDKNGVINFKEFLFAFTQWVGINEDDEEEDGEDEA